MYRNDKYTKDPEHSRRDGLQTAERQVQRGDKVNMDAPNYRHKATTNTNSRNGFDNARNGFDNALSQLLLVQKNVKTASNL